MKKLLLLCVLLLAGTAEAQPFQRETNTIPVEIYGWQPFSPWTGGYSLTAPELCDIDGDGDLDFFLGHDIWYPAFYMNTGTSNQPYFLWITNTYEPLRSAMENSNTAPRFCDIDHDGDFDVFINCLFARTNYYENIGDRNNPEFVLVIDTLKSSDGIVIGGEHTEFADIDSDGDFDLFAGRYYGTIDFYTNIGTSDSFSFRLTEPNFEGIDVGTQADPRLIDIDSDGDLDLLIGNGDGNIWYYQNIGNSVNYNFQLVTTQFEGIDVSSFATPTAADIDGDSDYELFIGLDANQDPDAPRGCLFYERNNGTPSFYNFEHITAEYLTMDEGYYCQGEFVDIDADNDYDMLLASGQNMSFFENIGTSTEPYFRLVTEQFANMNFSSGCYPKFYDIDNDGDFDIANSEGSFTYARVNFYQNVGTPQSAIFQGWFEVYQSGALGGSIDIADIDDDGDGDLFIGDGWGDLYYFENTGTPHQPSFSFVSQNYQGIHYPSNIYPTFSDFDQDGDFDLFFSGVYGGYGYAYYENIGTSTNPQLSLITTNYFGENYGGKVSFSDIDADSDLDCFFTLQQGGVNFLRNLAINGITDPRFKPISPTETTLSLFPNPSNAGTVVRFTLPRAGLVRVELFDVEGRNVGAHCERPVGEAGGFQGARSAPLQETWFPAGTHDLRLDASDLPSGVYLVRLETPQQQVTGKVVVVK
ncbi:MAG: T9SS type A sorting domain-containing protein [bacterium]|nr:T9SS type A sorting domain-containing protein [bacterium]